MSTVLNGIDIELHLVEGFKLKVTKNELADHCRKRAEHHRKRAADKEAELPRLTEVMESLKGQGKRLATTISNFSKQSGGYNLDVEHPVENLEKDIQDHRNKAIVFEWFAEHLLPFDYVLDENALIRLEILKR